MAKGKYARKRIYTGLYLWILVFVLAATSIWGVSAKYFRQDEKDLIVQARMFYFTSDLLKENGHTYTLNPETTSVTFSLRNFADSLRSSNCAIQYQVYIDGTEHGGVGELNSENPSADISFNVKPGETYKVEVRGIGYYEKTDEDSLKGYEKTLSATFKVETAKTGFYKYLDTSDSYYVLLTVWTENISGDVTVSFPAGLIPDATDSDLATIMNYSNGTYIGWKTGVIEFKEYYSKTYRFFKENPSSAYKVTQFDVTMDDSKTAEFATP